MSSITVTLVVPETGQSESIPAESTTTIQSLQEIAGALFGGSFVLLKDQQRLQVSSTLGDLNIQNGDLLLAVPDASLSRSRPAPAPSSAPSQGLDFGSLLSGLVSSGGPASPGSAPNPVYYPGMGLEEAQYRNPHPVTFCKLLKQQEDLRKQLNYYSPRIAAQLSQPGLSIDQMANIWRQEMVKGGIHAALNATNRFHESKLMQDRLDRDPNDKEAAAYFAGIEKKKRIAEQKMQVYEEYPEAFASVLMLFISAKINGHAIQAFCDSGAQSTIMSKKLAIACGLEDWIDESMAGIAVGVGTNKIIGRIHSVQLQIQNTYFPCTITVLDDPPAGGKDIDFLLGLDMMKRHLCIIDLSKSCLKFQISPGQYLEAPFLHEHDLGTDKGGTQGFDAAASNAEFHKRMEEDDS